MCWVDAFYVMSGSRFGRPSLSLLAQERQVCNVNSFQLPRMHLSTKSCLLLTWGRAQGKPVAHIFIKIHENPRWPWCLCGFTGACHTSGMVGQGLEVCWGYCPGGDTLTHSPASQPGLCSCSALKVEREMFSSPRSVLWTLKAKGNSILECKKNELPLYNIYMNRLLVSKAENTCGTN